MIGECKDLGLWPFSTFFQKGAFLTDFETGEVLLAAGGLTQGGLNPPPQSMAFYLKDFYTNQYRVYLPETWIKVSRQDLDQYLSQVPEAPLSIIESQNHDETYSKDFKSLKAAFGTALQKVVLISREEYKISHKELVTQTFFKRAMSFGSGFPYGFWDEDSGLVGSTPEILFSVKGRTLKTFALAGTAPKGQEDVLLNSQKDRLEHELVIRDIQEKLRFSCEGIKTSETGILNYKNMVHLKTDIQGEILENLNLLDLTSLMSPTAALGGYPKEASLKFLQGTEYRKKNPVRYFGSAFGTLHDDMKQFVVAIRNVQWKDGTFFIESGGGVLPASELRKELDELGLKRNTIKKHYL